MKLTRIGQIDLEHAPALYRIESHTFRRCGGSAVCFSSQEQPARYLLSIPVEPVDLAPGTEAAVLALTALSSRVRPTPFGERLEVFVAPEIMERTFVRQPEPAVERNQSETDPEPDSPLSSR